VSDNPHENQKVIFEGADITYAKSVMVLIHGRGAAAEKIMEFPKKK
jgi:hypothetical protein